MVKKGRSLSSILEPLEEQKPADVNARRKPDLPAQSDPNKLVPLAILVTRADRTRLKKLSVGTEVSLQKMGHEAWSQWLESRGLPPLEPVTANVPSGRRR